MANTELRVRGLREFTRELARGSKQLRKEIGRAHKAVGADVIVPAARRRMQQTAKGRGGNLGAKGIKPSASVTKAAILLSGSNPRTLGDEFGSLAYGQFRRWKGNQFTGLDPGQAGYAVQPTIREKKDQILEAYLDGYEDVLKRAYPERF